MTGVRRRRTVAVGAALVATAALVGGMAVSGGGPEGEAGYVQTDAPDDAELSRFFEVMRLAFTGVLTDAASFEQRATEVAAGTRPAADLTAALDASLRRAAGTRDLVGASADLAGLPEPRRLYLRSALLYAEALWALRAAVDSPEPARAELVLQARRLKLLSNRVYDRGTVVADPELPVVRETPDWDREGVQPGAGADAGGQAVSGWGRTLREFTARVRAKVAPPTNYEPSLARMAVMVDDEAASAFAFASTTSEPLRNLHEHRARRLALLGEDLWDVAPERHAAGLPDHPRSGFDRAGLDPEPVPGVDQPLGSR